MHEVVCCQQQLWLARFWQCALCEMVTWWRAPLQSTQCMG